MRSLGTCSLMLLQNRVQHDRVELANAYEMLGHLSFGFLLRFSDLWKILMLVLPSRQEPNEARAIENGLGIAKLCGRDDFLIACSFFR